MSDNNKKMKLIDIGVNLFDPMFKGIYRKKVQHLNDFEFVLKRASSFNVDKIIVTVTNFNEAQKSLSFVSKHKNLFTTIGVHPTSAHEFDRNPLLLDKLLSIIGDNPRENKIVAIGECGLDYDRLKFCSKETQLKHFEKHFVLSEKTGLPIFFHDRNTDGDFYKIVKRNRSRFKNGVVHSFTGSIKELNRYLDLNLYIGINGCSLKTELNLKVVKQIPIERMMFETDSPWCGIKKSHASYKYVKTTIEQKPIKRFELGKAVKSRNEPCFIIQIAEVVAALKSIDVKELIKIATENTEKVFFE